MEEDKPIKKDNRGGKRVGAGRKTQRETNDLLNKLSIYQDEALDVLMDLVRKGDIQAVKLYFSYAYGNPTTTNNTNITAEVTSVDLRDIITFGNQDENDFDDDELFS